MRSNGSTGERLITSGWSSSTRTSVNRPAAGRRIEAALQVAVKAVANRNHAVLTAGEEDIGHGSVRMDRGLIGVGGVGKMGTLVARAQATHYLKTWKWTCARKKRAFAAGHAVVVIVVVMMTGARVSRNTTVVAVTMITLTTVITMDATETETVMTAAIASMIDVVVGRATITMITKIRITTAAIEITISVTFAAAVVIDSIEIEIEITDATAVGAIAIATETGLTENVIAGLIENASACAIVIAIATGIVIEMTLGELVVGTMVVGVIVITIATHVIIVIFAETATATVTAAGDHEMTMDTTLSNALPNDNVTMKCRRLLSIARRTATLGSSLRKLIGILHRLRQQRLKLTAMAKNAQLPRLMMVLILVVLRQQMR
mmetsp:Transcript_4982/g.10578  ORF Transcript_4982/g.10578 Transcript_4982/m.10578 type:complete len:377 (+) Transcript_4982:159-1289(+)